MDFEGPRPREIKIMLGTMVSTALIFAAWAGMSLQASRRPVEARGPAGNRSIADPSNPSAFHGRSPTGAPISPRLQSIADMADYLERAETPRD